MEKQIQSNKRDERKHNLNLPSIHMLLLLHVLRHQQDHPRLLQLGMLIWATRNRLDHARLDPLPV